MEKRKKYMEKFFGKGVMKRIKGSCGKVKNFG